METILVVDDEKDLVDLVAYNLDKAGYKVEKAYDGPSALRQVHARLPHLVVLDLMLPGIDGLEICRRLRADPRSRGILILMLTAKGEETDKVVGLEVGADDYLTKPFSPRELVARIRALLRRASASREEAVEKPALAFPGLEIDPERHEVKVRKKAVELTAKEFKLLAFLAARPGKPGV
jgi:DNA-binding response OmpR family regulator